MCGWGRVGRRRLRGVRRRGRSWGGFGVLVLEVGGLGGEGGGTYRWLSRPTRASMERSGALGLSWAMVWRRA